jgi:hypothetical protein
MVATPLEHTLLLEGHDKGGRAARRHSPVDPSPDDHHPGQFEAEPDTRRIPQPGERVLTRGVVTEPIQRVPRDGPIPTTDSGKPEDRLCPALSTLELDDCRLLEPNGHLVATDAEAPAAG